MKIEIWSDIMCPFCYIGKRHLEAALQKYPELNVELEWKSFQLDPTITPQPGKDVYSYLAERKGMSVEESKNMHQGVIDRAAEVGLDYRFDKAVISNSLQAHQIIQLAKTKNLGDAMEERFFKAYFTEGVDLNSKEELVRLAVEIGLDSTDANETIEKGLYLQNVQHDVEEARQIGVSGVPFFVFDRKYAISGAQPVEAFVETIQAVLSPL